MLFGLYYRGLNNRMVVRGDLQKCIKARIRRCLIGTFEMKMSKDELNVPKFHEI